MHPAYVRLRGPGRSRTSVHRTVIEAVLRLREQCLLEGVQSRSSIVDAPIILETTYLNHRVRSLEGFEKGARFVRRV